MRAVLQRVSRASVKVEGEIVGSIGPGLLVLLGVARDDTERDAELLASRSAELRIFDDDTGRPNLSLLEVGAEMLVVSQFTLLANTARGRRPSYILAASAEDANRLYQHYVSEAAKRVRKVATGRFQAMMHVELVNDGPVTIILDSRKLSL